MIKPFLGRDMPNKNNKLGIRNLRYVPSTDKYVVQNTIMGVRKHIACFSDFETAKQFVKTMHTYDMNDPNEVDKFWEWARQFKGGDKPS